LLAPKDRGSTLLKIQELMREGRDWRRTPNMGRVHGAEGLSHTVDLFRVEDPPTVPAPTLGAAGVRHIAFLVDREQALKDSYVTLQAHGVAIVRAVWTT
jgi:catechol 2,3-dioxygenase-like lactoylglutathione lyase family enzyme